MADVRTGFGLLAARLQVPYTTRRLQLVGMRLHGIRPLFGEIESHMRHVGTLNNEAMARTFQSYLTTKNIKAQVEEEDGAWAIWIHSEDQIDEGRQELAEFRSDSEAPKYAAAVKEAEQLEKAKAKKLRDAQKRQVRVREDWEKPIYERCPVTFSLIGISLFVIAISTKLGEGGGLMSLPLCNKLEVTRYLYISEFVRPFLPEIRRGHLWRLVTPIFIHGTLLHIFFNVMWTRNLGSIIETRLKPLRFLMLVLFTAIVSNYAQAHISGPAFGGLSGVGFGFFGYIWAKGRYDPRSDLHMSQNMAVFGVLWIFIGYANILPGMANHCHLFGALAGIVAAMAPLTIKKMLG